MIFGYLGFRAVRSRGFRAYARWETSTWLLTLFLLWPLVTFSIVSIPAGIAAEGAWLALLAALAVLAKHRRQHRNGRNDDTERRQSS